MSKFINKEEKSIKEENAKSVFKFLLQVLFGIILLPYLMFTSGFILVFS